MTTKEFQSQKQEVIELAKTYHQLSGQEKWIRSVQAVDSLEDLRAWAKILTKAIKETQHFNQNYEGVTITPQASGKAKIDFIPKRSTVKKKPMYYLLTSLLLMITLPLWMGILLFLTAKSIAKTVLSQYSQWVYDRYFIRPKPGKLPPHIQQQIDSISSKLFPHD